MYLFSLLPQLHHGWENPFHFSFDRPNRRSAAQNLYKLQSRGFCLRLGANQDSSNVAFLTNISIGRGVWEYSVKGKQSRLKVCQIELTGFK